MNLDPFTCSGPSAFHPNEYDFDKEMRELKQKIDMNDAVKQAAAVPKTLPAVASVAQSSSETPSSGKKAGKEGCTDVSGSFGSPTFAINTQHILLLILIIVIALWVSLIKIGCKIKQMRKMLEMLIQVK